MEALTPQVPAGGAVSALARMFTPPRRAPRGIRTRLVVSGRTVASAKDLPPMPDADQRAAVKKALRKVRADNKYALEVESGGVLRRRAKRVTTPEERARWRAAYLAKEGNAERSRQSKLEHWHRKMADPAFREEHRLRVQESYRKRREDPEYVEHQRRRSRAQYAARKAAKAGEVSTAEVGT